MVADAHVLRVVAAAAAVALGVVARVCGRVGVTATSTVIICRSIVFERHDREPFFQRLNTLVAAAARWHRATLLGSHAMHAKIQVVDDAGKYECIYRSLRQSDS
jgi:hypothetical protein